MSANGRLTSAELTRIWHPSLTLYLANEAAASWNAMRFYALERHTDIYPEGPLGAYRDFAGQQRLWDLYQAGRGNLAAQPGSCLEVGTVILTERGLVPIEKVQIGDRVWTHKHRWRLVTDTRMFMSETVRVHPSGHAGLCATSDHRWFTFDGWKPSKKGIIHAGRDLRVRTSGELLNHLIAHVERFDVVDPPDDCPAEPSIEFARFCGHYVADGSFHDRGGPGDEGIIYSRVSKTDAVLANAGTAGVALSEWTYREDGVRRLRFGADLARWLAREFGGKSVERTVPTWILGAPLEQREAFLEGYLAGDGHWSVIDNKQSHWAYSTSSRALAYGMVMLARSLSMHAYVCNRAWPRECVVKGRRCVPTHEVFNVVIYPTRPAMGLRMWQHEGYVVSKVRKVEEAEPQLVFDLTVEEDESFIADGLVSHNSNHGWGLAVDLATQQMRSFIDRHGAYFGWQKQWSDAQSEWWHLKYRSGQWRPRPNVGISKTYPVLTIGSGGPGLDYLVRALHRHLQGRGYKTDGHDEFGHTTLHSLNLFQHAHGLHASGVTTPRTWQLLRS